MESVEVVFDFDQNCTLYELSEYICSAQVIPELRVLSKEEIQQRRERDKAEFETWWLSYAYDCHAITAPAQVPELELVCNFVKVHQLDFGERISNCDDLERVLKQAVEEDMIVPVMGPVDESCYVPSPKSAANSTASGWPDTFGAAPTLLSNGLGAGEPLLSGPYDPLLQEAKLKAARAGTRGNGANTGSGGFDWLGAVEAAGGAVAGDLSGGAEDGDDDSVLKSFGGPDGGRSLLDGAPPFEYQPKMPDGEVLALAKTPNDGEPGTWYINSGSGQMRLYGDGGQPVVDFDFDHDHGQGVPHAHNWSIDPLTGKNRRGSGVSFSILP